MMPKSWTTKSNERSAGVGRRLHVGQALDDYLLLAAGPSSEEQRMLKRSTSDERRWLLEEILDASYNSKEAELDPEGGLIRLDPTPALLDPDAHVRLLALHVLSRSRSAATGQPSFAHLSDDASGAIVELLTSDDHEDAQWAFNVVFGPAFADPASETARVAMAGTILGRTGSNVVAHLSSASLIERGMAMHVLAHDTEARAALFTMPADAVAHLVTTSADTRPLWTSSQERVRKRVQAFAPADEVYDIAVPLAHVVTSAEAWSSPDVLEALVRQQHGGYDLLTVCWQVHAMESTTHLARWMSQTDDIGLRALAVEETARLMNLPNEYSQSPVHHVDSEVEIDQARMALRDPLWSVVTEQGSDLSTDTCSHALAALVRYRQDGDYAYGASELTAERLDALVELHHQIGHPAAQRSIETLVGPDNALQRLGVAPIGRAGDVAFGPSN